MTSSRKAVSFAAVLLALTALISTACGAHAAYAAAMKHKPSGGYAHGANRRIGLASAPDAGSAWVATSRGNVFTAGGAVFYGSPVSRHRRLSHPVTAIGSAPGVRGYWTVTASGTVYAFGRARFYGSAHTSAIRDPIVAIAVQRSGKGYWLLSRNGTVYRFGASRLYRFRGARFQGRAVAILSTSDSRGFWLVNSAGGVYSYGDAHFYGSLSHRHASTPVVAAAARATGGGYWLVRASGNVYGFGRAKFYGSAAHKRHSGQITAVSTTADGAGYYLVSAWGTVLRFGDAIPAKAPAGTDILKPGSYGYDVSWPQCNESRPNFGHAFVIVGVNDGHTFSTNPCLKKECGWALTSPHPMLYVNTDNPGYTGSAAFRFGEQAAQSSLNSAARQHITTLYWWLDVETTNQWAGGYAGNTEVILGFIHTLRAAKRLVGVYSTGWQWGQITGGYQLPDPTPQWVPGAPAGNMGALCSAAFSRGRVWMTQSAPGSLDYDFACN